MIILHVICKYVPDLDDAANSFYQFNDSIWPDKQEFFHWQLLNGKIISLDQHDDLCIVWEHILGGGGNTIWLNCLHDLFIQRVTKFTIDTFMEGGRKIMW